MKGFKIVEWTLRRGGRIGIKVRLAPAVPSMLPSRREGEGLIYSGGEEKIRIACDLI